MLQSKRKTQTSSPSPKLGSSHPSQTQSSCQKIHLLQERSGPRPLLQKCLHRWETRWNPSFSQAGTQSNPPWEKRCWCRYFMGITSTSAKLKWLVGICYRPEVDELMIMEKNLWFNKLNRQWKQPTPRWFQFSEHQLGQLLSCKESRAVFYRCDTRPFSQASIRYIHQRRQHPGPGFYKIQWTNWGSHTAQVRESWSADETPLDTVQICQEGKEKTSSNQGSRTKKWTSCWPVNYRQGKERHWLGNHLCEGSLWDQDHRPVGREHQEVLELYPTLHKILEFHWRIRGRKFAKDSDKAEILNSFFCPVVTNEPLLDSTT